jgi:hypothetical protein
MSMIKIDGHEHNTDNISEEAKAQLQSLQFVDGELARLQAHAAVLQTARASYAAALKAALPVTPEGDTLKLN